MKRALAVFEGAVITGLVVMMGLAILAAIVDVIWVFLRDLVSPPFDLLAVNELLDVFGTFMIVLIAIELMDTVKMYLTHGRIQVELVLSVAVIAIARKIILLDVKELSPATLSAVAALILALTGGYYLMKRR